MHFIIVQQRMEGSRKKGINSFLTLTLTVVCLQVHGFMLVSLCAKALVCVKVYKLTLELKY